mmetsp:Transcript_68710/g.183060  ORF Transcript_68710/g.183060 Transcript_68710/m.183060 type:complete len:102 (+) Transcript_68710:237-542(+)
MAGAPGHAAGSAGASQEGSSFVVAGARSSDADSVAGEAAYHSQQDAMDGRDDRGYSLSYFSSAARWLLPRTIARPSFLPLASAVTVMGPSLFPRASSFARH